jgi:hypothetical protein
MQGQEINRRREAIEAAKLAVRAHQGQSLILSFEPNSSTAARPCAARSCPASREQAEPLRRVACGGAVGGARRARGAARMKAGWPKAFVAFGSPGL